MQTKSNHFYFIGIIATALLASVSVTAGEKSSRHDFPPAVTGFHDVMAPLWHSSPGEGRDERICKDYSRLSSKLDKIRSEVVPKEVDKADWKSAAYQLQQYTLKVKLACDSNQSPDATFADVHSAFHNLVRLVGHRH